MDSAGFLPHDIEDIILNIKKFKVKLGFHGHNNLEVQSLIVLQHVYVGQKLLMFQLKVLVLELETLKWMFF